MRPSLRSSTRRSLQTQAGGVVDGAELEDGDQEILCHGFSRSNTDQKITEDIR